MLLSAAGLFAIIYGLIVKKAIHIGTGRIFTSIEKQLVGGLIVMMIIFIIAEAKIKDPMVNLSMFKKPHFIGVVIVAFALGSGIYAYNTFLTALMQNYIGYSATQTGLRQVTF